MKLGYIKISFFSNCRPYKNMKQKDPNIVFHSVITSERHRTLGYCENNDFGSIALINLSPDKKELIVAYQDDNKSHEYVSYNNKVYRKIIERNGITHFSREEEQKYQNLQGKFTVKTALGFVLEMRSRMEHSFSSPGEKSYLLIGRTLYYEYCKPKELTITVCGNLLFSCWLSIHFECHGNKITHKLNKPNFEKVLSAQKKRFEEARPAEGKRNGDGHVSFSHPTKIVWGENFK